MPTNINK